ncbi:dihydropyrimidinase [Crystallibacter degradans]|uniref:D-hydantoinase n=1 Tax=Crystallibacter crystallopoietes TaxID=37928 RepID=Q84FR6_9MICC|nr:dihydropyrimidinase [Arthrobacter sp. SF27]AAO24771.1 D-hydantoinase [Arthrobacter crystallopoietes]NMR29124.1 dihydropyrimidinase [Arthrobacter sp. SF27]
MDAKLLVGGTIVSSTGKIRADVLIENGKVAAVGMLDAATPDTVERVDCDGKYVMPGGIDVHTHIDSPLMGTTTADDFVSGTIAAATGGTTTIVDFGQQLAGKNLLESADAHHKKAQGKSVIDYGFHMCVTNLYDNFDSHMAELTQDGISSFKVFMAYRGSLMINDGELFDILKGVGSSGAKLCVHAENGDVIDRIAADLYAQGKTGPGTHEIARPPESEVEAVSRAIKISRMAEVPLYFVHLSTQGAVEEVAAAQMTGWPISAETCTHYLSLSRDIYDQPGFEPAKAVLTPPLRTQEHQDALWRGINTGALSVVSSDHCPFCFEEKQRMGADDFRQIPNGGPGVEHRMLVMYETGVAEGKMTIEKFVEVTAENPAKQFDMYPKKGTIAPGSDADIIVVDPNGTTLISADTQKQNMDYTLFEGFKIRCSIDQVFSRGDLISVKGEYVGTRGRGEFIKR